MSQVLADQAGFAVDWDWHRGLTVWTLAGSRYESRFAAKVIEHQLPDRPPTERRARRAAHRWWRAEGRSRAHWSGRRSHPRRKAEQRGPPIRATRAGRKHSADPVRMSGRPGTPGRGRYGLAAEHERPGDDDDLTGGPADRERILACRARFSPWADLPEPPPLMPVNGREIHHD